MRKLLLVTLTFASINALAVRSTSFQQLATCTYTDEANNEKQPISLLVNELGDNEARSSGLIIFKDMKGVDGKTRDYAETTSVNYKDLKKVTVTLEDDNIVDLSSKHGKRLIFDINGKAELQADYGKYECQLSVSAE